MSADVDFQVQHEFWIKAIYNKTYSLKWFPFKESHWYITYYTHYPRFRIKKIFTQKKIKEILKHELFTFFFFGQLNYFYHCQGPGKHIYS